MGKKKESYEEFVEKFKVKKQQMIVIPLQQYMMWCWIM